MSQKVENQESENEKPKEVQDLDNLKEFVEFIKTIKSASENSNSEPSIIIRKGEAAEIYEPLKTNISGSIKAPAEYARLRADTIDAAHSHLEINSNTGAIKLIVNENDPLKIVVVEGKIKSSAELNKFNINVEEATYTIDGLRELFRPLRFYFATLDDFISINNKINGFNAKVESFFKDHRDDATGSVSKQFEKKVINNADSGYDTMKFNVKIRLYEDYERVIIPVELYPIATNNNIVFRLVSLDLHSKLEEVKELLLAETLALIPDIPKFTIN